MKKCLFVVVLLIVNLFCRCDCNIRDTIQNSLSFKPIQNKLTYSIQVNQVSGNDSYQCLEFQKNQTQACRSIDFVAEQLNNNSTLTKDLFNRRFNISSFVINFTDESKSHYVIDRSLVYCDRINLQKHDSPSASLDFCFFLSQLETFNISSSSNTTIELNSALNVNTYIPKYQFIFIGHVQNNSIDVYGMQQLGRSTPLNICLKRLKFTGFGQVLNAGLSVSEKAQTEGHRMIRFSIQSCKFTNNGFNLNKMTVKICEDGYCLLNSLLVVYDALVIDCEFYENRFIVEQLEFRPERVVLSGVIIFSYGFDLVIENTKVYRNSIYMKQSSKTIKYQFRGFLTRNHETL